MAGDASTRTSDQQSTNLARFKRVLRVLGQRLDDVGERPLALRGSQELIKPHKKPISRCYKQNSTRNFCLTDSNSFRAFAQSSKTAFIATFGSLEASN